jgi:hypothetical protein
VGSFCVSARWIPPGKPTIVQWMVLFDLKSQMKKGGLGNTSRLFSVRKIGFEYFNVVILISFNIA